MEQVIQFVIIFNYYLLNVFDNLLKKYKVIEFLDQNKNEKNEIDKSICMSSFTPTKYKIYVVNQVIIFQVS